LFYTIYQITNKVNGKIYIGMHQTKNLNDGYMGSGMLIQKAIKKYGIENFVKTIMFTFDNEHDMKEKEKELVTEEFLERQDVYNLCPGGKGGWGYLNKTGKNNSGRKHSQHTKDKLSKSKTGIKHTDKTKNKISYIMKTQRNTEEWKIILSINAVKKPENFSNTIKNSEKCKKQRSELYRKVNCPHCSKIGSYNTMKRYHFDNCKFK
jgi:hypothetical protein